MEGTMRFLMVLDFNFEFVHCDKDLSSKVHKDNKLGFSYQWIGETDQEQKNNCLSCLRPNFSFFHFKSCCFLAGQRTWRTGCNVFWFYFRPLTTCSFCLSNRSAFGYFSFDHYRSWFSYSCIFHFLHEGWKQRALWPLLFLPQSFYFFYAVAGAGSQLHHHVHRLGRSRPLFLFTHWILVQEYRTQ